MDQSTLTQELCKSNTAIAKLANALDNTHQHIKDEEGSLPTHLMDYDELLDNLHNEGVIKRLA